MDCLKIVIEILTLSVNRLNISIILRYVSENMINRAAYCHLGGDTIQFAIQVQQYAIRFAIR